MTSFVVRFSELSERKREKQKNTCYAGGEKTLASSLATILLRLLYSIVSPFGRTIE